MRSGLLVILLLCSWQLFAQTYVSILGAEDGGTYLWRQALGGMVIAQPAVQARSLTVITDGGSLRAYSLAGRPLWNFSARGRLSPFLTRSREGTSFIARTGGTLIAVSGSGRELWRAELGGDLSGPVVLGWDGRVFAPTARGISCYTASGTLLWRHDFDHRISAGPWLDRTGGLLLALGNGEVLRVSPFGEIARWGFTSAPSLLVSIDRPPSSNPGPGGPGILALHGSGDAWMIDPSMPGTVPYRLPRLPGSPAAVAGMNSRAAVVLANGQTLMLSAEGDVLWVADSHIRGGGRPGEVAVIYDERGVYVLTQDGATGFTGCGGRLWTTTLRNVSGLPAFGDNGVLYSGGTNWILYAWRLEDRALGRSPGPRAAYGTGDPPPSSISALPTRFSENLVRRELQSIRRGISAGRVGRNELEWIAFLKETAEGGARPGRDAIVPITYRVQALRLLSDIGSGENVPWLLRFFRREQDQAVRAAAVAAIGRIGFDPGGMALGEFASIAGPGGQARDEQLLLSIAAATGALCRASGGELYEAGVRVLILLGAPGQPLSVQRRARLELDTLRGGP